MGLLRELTEGYLGSLRYAREVAGGVALPLGLIFLFASFCDSL